MKPLDPDLQAMAWALLHFFWQGCLVWFLVALLLRFVRGWSARVRYLIGVLGLMACLVLPMATFFHLRHAVISQAGARAMIVALPDSQVRNIGMAASTQKMMAQSTLTLRTVIEPRLTSIFRVWFLGCILFALHFGGGWLGLRRIRRSATAVPDALKARLERLSRHFGLFHLPRIALTHSIHTPVVMGWLRPLILIPAGILTGLDPVAVDALLVHELAHIRRHDYLVNLVQCVVEILLFYHPAVWWISRRVRTERELCCDDVAVGWCADPLLYAETLTRLHELRSETLSPALAAGGGDLMFRIKRLLIPSLSPSMIPLRLNLLALACSLCLLFAAGISTNALHARSANEGEWFQAGSNKKDYIFSTDAKTTHSGKPSQTMSCTQKEPEGFGTFMQNFVPTEYLGKRVCMSAWVKTANVSGWAGLWMRVDGDGEAPLAFDNMGKRPLKGTLDWKRYEVVLDVAPGAENIAFGVLMDGLGQVWLDDLRFEVVDTSVPITNTAGGPPASLPPAMDSQKWFLLGSHPKDYTISLDPAVLHEGKPTHLLASKAEKCKGFGTLMQMFKGQTYYGKRIHLSAWVKSENVEDWAGVWMRVDGKDYKSTAFDNMENRAIKGTTDWKRYEVVLDVASDSQDMALGILLAGKGKVWIDEPVLEIVDQSVPVTDMKGAYPKDVE